jgi:hypothetical protein
MEFLSDPKDDRMVKDLRPPPLKPLSSELLFPPNYKGNRSF